MNRDDLVLRVEKEELGNEVGIRQHHYDVLFFWYLIGFGITSFDVSTSTNQWQFDYSVIDILLMLVCGALHYGERFINTAKSNPCEELDS